jgi:hypothetical protein
MWWARLLNNISGLLSAGGVVAGDYESIATSIVGSGGTPSISFNTIPSTYKHLQVRCLARQSGSGTGQPLIFTINGVTSGYAVHNVNGNGSGTPVAQGYANEASIFLADQLATSSNTSGIFSTWVIDILDYANTNKFKTVRALGGFDANGAGRIALNSALLQSTSAISTITFSANSGNLVEYSHFALYGIKG